MTLDLEVKVNDTTLTQLKYQLVNWKRVFFCSSHILAKTFCRMVLQTFKSYLKQALGRLAKSNLVHPHHYARPLLAGFVYYLRDRALDRPVLRDPTYNAKRNLQSPQGTMYMLVHLFCLYILSLCTLTHAQFQPTSRGECIQYCQDHYSGVYSGTRTSPDAAIPSKWCRYWGLECDCIQTQCSTFQIKCNYVSKGTSSEDNCSVGEFYSVACLLRFLMQLLFLEVDQDVIPPLGALVPGPTTTHSTTTQSRPTTRPWSTSSVPPPVNTSGPIYPTENPPASAGAAAGTILLLVGAALGSLFAVNRALASPSAFSSHGYGHGRTATIPTPVGTVGFQASFLFHCASAVDPVSLLLHFQFLSFSGLLVLEYPRNYLGFTYNFAWANFLIPFPPFKKAATGLMSKSCWKAGLDKAPLGGFDFLATRYGILVHNLAGVVYICVSAGIGIALAFFVLVGVILFLLERTTRSSKNHETTRGFQERWAAISSNTTLRLVS